MKTSTRTLQICISKPTTPTNHQILYHVHDSLRTISTVKRSYTDSGIIPKIKMPRSQKTLNGSH